MKKKLVVFVIGGIGNQIIQYFSAKKIADDFGFKLVPVIVGFKKKGSIFSKEGISILQISESIKFLPIPCKFQEVIFRRLFNFFELKKRVIINKKVSILVHGKHDDICVATNTSKYLLIVDYFLDKSFLDLNKFLNINKEYNFENQEFINLKNEIKKNNVIGLHVRRGNYFLYGEKIGTLSDKYYVNIVKRIILENPDNKRLSIWIFTQFHTEVVEFIEELKTICNFDIKVITEKQLPALQTIFLSIFCEWFVGSNSTFSYWIAVFRQDKNYLPSTFYRTSEKIFLTMPKNTILIEPIWY